VLHQQHHETFNNHSNTLALETYSDISTTLILFIPDSLYFPPFTVRPRIVPFEFDSPIYAGQAAQVTCLVAEGDQPMEINWSFQATHMGSQNGISTNKFGSKASILMVDPANSGHSGNYTCTVKNIVGVVNYTASLEIHGICDGALVPA